LPVIQLGFSGAKKLRFRAKVTQTGEKIHIIIPVLYHDKARKFLGKTVEVEIEDISEEE
jgi:hypothetical protein